MHRVVGVTFDGGRNTSVYDYYVPEWVPDHIVEGDHAIVDSPYNGFACVTVVRVEERTTRPAKPIVCLINTDAYDEAKALKVRKEEIEDRLVGLMKEQKKADTYEKLAKKNPEAKKLLGELKGM